MLYDSGWFRVCRVRLKVYRVEGLGFVGGIGHWDYAAIQGLEVPWAYPAF